MADMTTTIHAGCIIVQGPTVFGVYKRASGIPGRTNKPHIGALLGYAPTIEDARAIAVLAKLRRRKRKTAQDRASAKRLRIARRESERTTGVET